MNASLHHILHSSKPLSQKPQSYLSTTKWSNRTTCTMLFPLDEKRHRVPLAFQELYVESNRKLETRKEFHSHRPTRHKLKKKTQQEHTSEDQSATFTHRGDGSSDPKGSIQRIVRSKIGEWRRSLWYVNWIASNLMRSTPLFFFCSYRPRSTLINSWKIEDTMFLLSSRSIQLILMILLNCK